MGTEWHTGIVEDEVGHSGAKQLFNGMVVWSIFYNGIQVIKCRSVPGRLHPKLYHHLNVVCPRRKIHFRKPENKISKTAKLIKLKVTKKVKI